MVFSDACKVFPSGFVYEQNCLVWVQKVRVKFFKCQTTDPWLSFGVPYRKSSNRALFLPYLKVTGETFKSLLWYYAFVKFREYPEHTILQQDGSSRPLLFLYVIIGPKVPPWDKESWLHFIASSLTGFDTMWKLLWDLSKKTICREPPNTNSELNSRITVEAASNNEDSLKNAYKTRKIVHALYREKKVVI